MDKQIIIDGVNVNKCKHFVPELETEIIGEKVTEKDKCYHSGIEIITDCKGNKGCIYKQLQRAKAENKELERKYADVLKLAKENADSNEYCLQELEKENEQLKADIESRTMCITCERELQNCNLQAENERLKEENNELYKRMAEVTYRVTGGRLSYPNYTLDAIEQAFYDQLEILSDQKSEEYKQALQEIREIAKEQLQDVSDRCINTTPMYIVHKHILDKINEVIGAE